jgi:hypothetical protein
MIKNKILIYSIIYVNTKIFFMKNKVDLLIIYTYI